MFEKYDRDKLGKTHRVHKIADTIIHVGIDCVHIYIYDAYPTNDVMEMHIHPNEIKTNIPKVGESEGEPESKPQLEKKKLNYIS